MINISKWAITWFHGTNMVRVNGWNGDRWNCNVTAPPPLTRTSNLLIELGNYISETRNIHILRIDCGNRNGKKGSALCSRLQEPHVENRWHKNDYLLSILITWKHRNALWVTVKSSQIALALSPGILRYRLPVHPYANMSHVPRRLIDNALFNLNLFSVAMFWARRVDARVISNGILMDYVALSVCVCGYCDERAFDCIRVV